MAPLVQRLYGHRLNHDGTAKRQSSPRTPRRRRKPKWDETEGRRFDPCRGYLARVDNPRATMTRGAAIDLESVVGADVALEPLQALEADLPANRDLAERFSSLLAALLPQILRLADGPEQLWRQMVQAVIAGDPDQA